jgi:hypothetical protein
VLSKCGCNAASDMNSPAETFRMRCVFLMNREVKANVGEAPRMQDHFVTCVVGSSRCATILVRQVAGWG